MWVSLAQTIVHEPDQARILNFLQDLLQGTSVLVDNAEQASGKSGDPLVTQENWAVTNTFRKLQLRERACQLRISWNLRYGMVVSKLADRLPKRFVCLRVALSRTF